MTSTLRTARRFRPLVVAMALMTMPPELTRFSLVSTAQAAPNIVPTPDCRQAGGNYLIQLVCTDDSSFPSDAVGNAIERRPIRNSVFGGLPAWSTLHRVDGCSPAPLDQTRGMSCG